METFSLPQIYLAAEQAKSSQQRRSMNDEVMADSKVQAYQRDLQVLGGFASQVLEAPDPVAFYNSSLPQLRNAVRSPEILQSLNPTNDPNEIRTDAESALRLSQAFARGQSGDPAGFVEFQRLTEAAGYQPGTQDYQQAAQVRLGTASRAGQTRVLDVNGVPTVVGTTDQGQPFQIPLSDLQQTAGAAGAIKQAEALGSGRGQAEAKREAEAPQREQNRRQVETTIDSVMGEVDRALENTAWSTSGFIGSRLASVEGTPAYNLRATLDTIKANLGFDKLQAMREASPTGGALGAVSERELTLLTSAIASLDQAQSDDQLRSALQKIKRHYENWKEVIQESRAADPYAPQQQTQTDPLGIR